MEQKRLLQIAFIFFACGLSIELLKTLGKNSPLNLKPATVGIKLDDYDVQYGTTDLPVEMPVIPLANSISGYQKISGVKLADKKGTDPKKDPKKDAKKKEEEKKVAKKKKKKKKKKIDSFEPDDDSIAKKNLDKKDGFSGANAPGGSYTVNNTTITNPQDKDKNKNTPKTLQEWENLLLKDPSPEEVKKFVDLYRSREVSGEVYYTIAKKMLEDQRPPMRQLGLTLLESSPSLTSFEVLANSYYHESNNSTFRPLIDRQLANYSRPESFNILVQGLSRQKSLAVNFTSVTVLNRAIERYKTEQARIATATAGTNTAASAAPGPTVRPSRVQSLFSRFTLPLKVLIAENDPNLAPTAAQTLTQLQALLN